jgi:DNA invertase Pin-like site-specific DNA recombinase
MSTASLQLPVVAGIVRVSTKAQGDGMSPDNQRQVLAAAGATRFFEAVESGFKDNRRQSLQPLFAAIEAGEISKLLATDLSRAARQELLLDELITTCDAHGVEFLAGGMAMSHEDAYGWFSAKQLQLQAELYSRDLSQRVKRGQAAAVARGIPAFTRNHLPFHLQRIEGTKHGVEPNPETWPAARDAALAYLNGDRSMQDIADQLQDAVGCMGHTAVVLKWLTGWAIRGHYGTRDRWIKNKKGTFDFVEGRLLIENCFPALLSTEEADLLDLRLKANARKRRRGATYTYPLSAITKCQHCGVGLTYSCVKKPDGSQYQYLRCKTRPKDCPAGGKRIRDWIVEESLLWHLEQQDLDALQVLDRGTGAKPTKELLEAKRKLRKLEVLLEGDDDPDLRASYERTRAKVAALSGQPAGHATGGLQALVRRLSIGSAGWYSRLSDGQRNGAWLQSLDGQAPVDLMCSGEGWQKRLSSPVFKL